VQVRLLVGSMRSMRSMRGGFIFRSQGTSLKVDHSQYLANMTLVDTLYYVIVNMEKISKNTL
jgi:hypothetical protein